MSGKHVILYFGSFNPVHRGHMAIAEYVLALGKFDELWFVVSPQNPFKSLDMLADGQARLDMVALAVENSKMSRRMSVCSVEFDLPLPSYTVNTMNELKKRYSDVSFSILTGSDSAAAVEKWRDWKELLEKYEFYVYPRSGSEVDDRFVLLKDAPVFDCSSTQIRQLVAENGDFGRYVCEKVEKYIKRHELWR